MKRTLVALTAAALLSGAAYGDTTFNITVTGDGGPFTAGATVNYQVTVELSEDNTNALTGNEGLALIGFDLSFDGGDLAQAAAPAGVPMENFVKDLGLTNPAGFGGTIDDSGSFDVLLQVGGAQNTINNFVDVNNAPYPIGPVATGVAWPGSAQVVATGTLTAPAGDGTYFLSISNAFANVIEAGEDGAVFWATKEALVSPAPTPFEVVVSACAPATYISSLPDSNDVGESAIRPQGTLWRTTKNVIRITLDGAAGALPASGEVEIRELLDGGGFGTDLAGSFDFSLESGNTVLRIADTASTIENSKWYAVSSSSWGCVGDFERHYASNYGDGNGDALTQFADLSFVNAGVGSPVSSDQDRHDINGDGLNQFADLSAANASIGINAAAKPAGH